MNRKCSGCPASECRVLKIVLQKRIIPVTANNNQGDVSAIKGKEDESSESEGIIRKLKRDSLYGRRCPMCNQFWKDFPRHLSDSHRDIYDSLQGLGKKF